MNNKNVILILIDLEENTVSTKSLENKIKEIIVRERAKNRKLSIIIRIQKLSSNAESLSKKLTMRIRIYEMSAAGKSASLH